MKLVAWSGHFGSRLTCHQHHVAFSFHTHPAQLRWRWKGQTNEAPKCQKPERPDKFESRLMHLSDQLEKFASCRVGGGLSLIDTCGCLELSGGLKHFHFSRQVHC